MHDELRRQCRIAAGRRPEPTAAVIDSQSVKAAETVASGSRGYDAGKKVNGRKRHIAVDTIGLLLTVLVTAAGVQDRDGARPLLWNLRKAFPKVRLTWADGGYAGKLVTWAKNKLRLTLEIVKRPDDLHDVQGAAPPLGGRADPGMDHQVTPQSGTTSGSPPTTRPWSTGR